jgi:hypothetical protein
MVEIEINVWKKNNVGLPKLTPGVDDSLKVNHGLKFTQVNDT